MNFVKSSYNSSLNEEANAPCTALKTTKYKPDIKYPSILGAATETSLIVNYVHLLHAFIFMYNMNKGLSLLLYYCHSDIFVV
jgi:hypothetical protein